MAAPKITKANQANSNPTLLKIKDQEATNVRQFRQAAQDTVSPQPMIPMTMIYTAQGAPTPSAMNVSEMSIEDLMLAVLGENADQGREDLTAIKDRIDTTNAQRAAMRDVKEMIRNGRGRDSIGNFIRDNNLGDVISKPESGWNRDDYMSTVEDAAQGLNDINSSNLFELQVIATRVTQAEQAMSSVFKKFSDAASAIINNI